MPRPLRTFLFILLCLGAEHAQAIRVQGIVREAASRLPLRGARVTLEVGGKAGEVHITRVDGFYRFEIRAGQEARIRFEHTGRLPRHVLIDARDVPRVWNDELEMSTDMRLFPELEGTDSTMLSAPAGLAKWDAAEENMVWDEQWSAPLVQRWDTLLEQHLAAHPNERPPTWQRTMAKVFDVVNEWALASVAVLLLLVHLALKFIARPRYRTIRIPLLLGLLAGSVFLVYDLRTAAGPLRYAALMGLVMGGMAVVGLVQAYLFSGISGESSDTPVDGYIIEQDEEDELAPEEMEEGASGTKEIEGGRTERNWGKLNMVAFFAGILLLILEGRRGLENNLDAWSLVGLGVGLGLLAALLLAWVRTPHHMRSFHMLVLRNGGVFLVVLPLLCVAGLSFVNRSFAQGEERCRTWAIVDISRGRNRNVTVSWDGERERLEMPRAIKAQLTTLDSLRCCVRTGLFGYEQVMGITPVITEDPR